MSWPFFVKKDDAVRLIDARGNCVIKERVRIVRTHYASSTKPELVHCSPVGHTPARVKHFETPGMRIY